MKKEILSTALLMILGFASCDDGKIYNNNHIATEGSTLKITSSISGTDKWPTGYSVVVAGFAESDYAVISKGISASGTEGETASVILGGVPEEVKQIEVCVINSLRKRIATFYEVDFNAQKDTIFIDAGTIDASMFNCIQKNVFDAHCIACHGTSTSAAGGLYLTKGKSYSALVNVKADLSPEEKMLVDPGKPDNSFILDVVLSNTTRHDHSDILSVMPEKTTLLKSWIEGGAQPSAIPLFINTTP